MKFTAATLLLATASAISLPAQDSPYGTEQNPSNSVSISWGRDGGSNTWGSIPQPASNPYNSPSSWSSFPPSNPFAQSNPFPRPYNPNPYNPNPYTQPAYVPQPAPYVPQPAPYIPPVAPAYTGPGSEDVNAPLSGLGPDQAPQQVTIEKTGYSGKDLSFKYYTRDINNVQEMDAHLVPSAL